MTIDKKQSYNLLIKIIVEVSRVILGVTFMFSGFVKAVDPWGTAYKIEDYLSAFGLSGLSFMSFPASLFLCILEFILGAFMLFGLYRYWTSRLILLTMFFMTTLTLYLAIADPVSDCGCFGDVLIISNWQTFYKNIVLLACAIITCIFCERIFNVFTGKTYWLAFLFIIMFSIGFVCRNYIYEPIFDFRPFHIGSHLPSKMVVEDDKKQIEESFLIYEKDGVKKEFTQDDFPWDDSTWIFVKMETKIIKEGEDPAIKDFSVRRLDFDNKRKEILSDEDITEAILSDSNYTFLMISPSLENLNIDYLSSVEDVDSYAQEFGYNFYALTASVTPEILKFIDKHSVNFNFGITDERILKTASRTNPGLLLIKDGIVINKWADIEIPSEESLQGLLTDMGFDRTNVVENENKKKFYSLILIFLVPLLLLKIIDFSIYRHRKLGQKEKQITNK